MSDYDVFLSYNWRDHEQVERLAKHLLEAGVNVFLDRWYLSPGTNWLQALEGVLESCRAVAVCLGAEMGQWQLREQYAALERQADAERDGRVLPLIPVLLPGSEPPLGFLRQNTWVDLRSGLDDSGRLAVLIKAIHGEPPGPDARSTVQTTLTRVCPYRGLLFFREEDAEFFFGREEAIQQLQETVEAHSLVALVGASGCGKSSVVRAGLVPMLRRSKSRVWEVATLVPSDRPFHALASVLLPMLEPQASEVERLGQINLLSRQFADGTIALRDVVDRVCAKQPGTDRLILVVDQWEELFTLTSDEVVRRRFIDTILEGAERARLTVLLALRGDFFGRAVASYRPLSDRVQGAQINLGPMNEAELRRAIEEPARKVGLSFEAGLVDTILADAGDEPGNLPLLEFVLRQLWEARQGGLMHREAYLSMGRLNGAIAQKADALYATLGGFEQLLLREVFMRLVHPGQGEHDTRRRATATEFGPDATALVKRLSDERLLVTSLSGDTETVEVAHEALIRSWQMLRRWVDEDRQFMTWQQDLHETAAKWRESKRSPDLLLRGKVLKTARQWQMKRPRALSELECAFLGASVQRKRLRVSIYVGAPTLVVLAFVGVLANEIARMFDGIAAAIGAAATRRPSTDEDKELAIAVAYDTIGGAKEATGHLGEARKFYEEGARIRERVTVAYSANDVVQRDLSRSYVRLGGLEFVRHEFDAARRYYEQSRRICESHAKAAQEVWSYWSWPDELRETYERLGAVALAARQFDEARRNYRLAQELVQRTEVKSRGASDVQLRALHNAIGDLELAAGQLDSARTRYGQGLEVAERLKRGSTDASSTFWDHDLSENYSKLGDVEFAARNFTAARSNYYRAWQILDALPTGDDGWRRDQREEGLRAMFNRIGDLEMAMSRLDAAEKRYRQGLEISELRAKRQPTLYTTKRDAFESYVKMGDVLTSKRENAKALQYLRKALAINGALLDGDPTMIVWKRDADDVQSRISQLEANGLQ